MPALCGFLGLVACSAPDAEPEAPAGAHTLPLLAGIHAADLAAQPLEGELGCSFTAEESVLLAAKGWAADANGHAQALAKVGGEPRQLVARQPGGFDPLPKGAVFTGAGSILTVRLLSDQPIGAGESPAYLAELRVETPGAKQRIEGRWTCGP